MIVCADCERPLRVPVDALAITGEAQIRPLYLDPNDEPICRECAIKAETRKPTP